MIQTPNPNNAAKVQKSLVGYAAMVLAAIAIGAFSTNWIMSRSQTQALNKCEEKYNQLARDVMMKAGLIRDVNTDTTYTHIADSINRLLTRKFEDKEITKTK